jgi:hypothetical protein
MATQDRTSLQWFYAVNGGHAGPFGFDAICELLHQRKIFRDTLVWNETFGQTWQPIRDTEIAATVKGVPPPLPPKALPPLTAVKDVGPHRSATGSDSSRVLKSNELKIHPIRWLIVLARLGAGFYFGPSILESADTPCDALVERAIAINVPLDAHGKPDAVAAGLVQDTVVTGLLRAFGPAFLKRAIQTRYPDVPPQLACALVYWRSRGDPDSLRRGLSEFGNKSVL